MSLVMNLKSKFVETYGKQIADLNKNIYPSAKLEDGNFEAPMITIGPLGGTTFEETPPEKLNIPARVMVDMKHLKPFNIVYRLAIPRPECEIMEKNPAYFKFFFDKVLDKALGNYTKTVGSPDVLRFGESYVKIDLLELDDGADSLELKLSGCWASEKVAE